MHQNLSCFPYCFSSDIGIEEGLLFLVILFDKINPVSKPSFKLSSRVKLPLADPTTVSFWRD